MHPAFSLKKSLPPRMALSLIGMFLRRLLEGHVLVVQLFVLFLQRVEIFNVGGVCCWKASSSW